MALQRAKLTNLQTTAAIEVQFNPTELALSKGAQFAEIAIPGLDSPILQFIRGSNETISLELFFDGTDSGMDEQAKGAITQGTREIEQETVAKKVEALYQLVKIDRDTHAPPVCELTWSDFAFGTSAPGAKTFRCVVESIERRFLLFSPKGVPLRARATLRLREYRTIAEQVQQPPLSSPDRTHTHVVQRGDRLDKIAAHFYGDPGEWRRIADENHIRDPRRLAVGSVLTIPPIPVE